MEAFEVILDILNQLIVDKAFNKKKIAIHYYLLYCDYKFMYFYTLSSN